MRFVVSHGGKPGVGIGLAMISVRGGDQRHQRANCQRDLRDPHDYLHRRFPADRSTGLLQSCSLILRSGASCGAPRGSL
jgi:hypothetical protein